MKYLNYESYGAYNEKIFLKLEERLMSKIIDWIVETKGISSPTDYRLLQLLRMDMDSQEVKKMIASTLNESIEYIDYIFDQVLEESYFELKHLYDAKKMSFKNFKDNEFLQNVLRKSKSYAIDEMIDVFDSLGFVVYGINGMKVESLTEFYQRRIHLAMIDIASGSFDFNSTLQNAVKEMINSGVRWIDYESGRHNRITVVARRSVMKGLSKMYEECMLHVAKELDIDTFEVSAHMAARPEHVLWQGGIYTKQELIDICHLGDVKGLKGANCYHDYYPFLKGVSKRSYTDEELEKYRSSEIIKYGDKEYTPYEAKQQMRMMEINIRAQREKVVLLQKGGADENDVLIQRMRYQAMLNNYSHFAVATNQKTQVERITVDGLRINLYDKIQYERYKSVLGDKDYLKTFETFREIKYNNISAWDKVKYKYSIVNAYEYNSELIMAADKICFLDNKALRCKRDNFTGKLKYRGNIAVMEIDGKLFFAHSGVNKNTDRGYINFKENEEVKRENIVLKKDSPIFATFTVGNIEVDRTKDSEAKLFEFASSIVEDGEVHNIYILSELSSCESCKGVLQQFINRYQKVNVYMVSSKKERMNHMKGNVWRNRK